jgi:hypothetical protein
LSDEGKTKYKLFSFGLGLTLYPRLFGTNSKLDVSPHLYLGFMQYKSEFDIAGNSYSTKKTSICPNLGAALNYNLSDKWEISDPG